ncbi:hypothetical protein D3C77_486120 [compost metagenome]
MLGACCPFKAVRTELRHALQQAHVYQAPYAVDHLFIPVDDRLGAVVVDQRAATLHVSHRGHTIDRREVHQEPATAGVQAFPDRVLRQLLKAGAVAAGVLLQVLDTGWQLQLSRLAEHRTQQAGTRSTSDVQEHRPLLVLLVPRQVLR